VEKAREVLSYYEEFTRTEPDELTAAAGLLGTPDGMPVAGMVVVYSGSPAEDERLRERFRQPGAPVADLVRRMSYLEAQSLLDAGYPPGRQHYWKAAFLSRLGAGAIEPMTEYFARRPSPLTLVLIEHWHGAAMRVEPTATAFAHRGERYNFSILGVWESATESEKNLAWTREFWEAMQPHTVARTYVNYLSEGEGERVREAYGPNYERLAALKQKYDPDNFFRMNQNIVPARAAAD
jgi:FAD/FMN-containing dehydrogenase